MSRVDEIRKLVVECMPKERVARTFAEAAVDRLIMEVRLECAEAEVTRAATISPGWIASIKH